MAAASIKTIQDLRPDPRNANKGTPRGHSIIERSLRQRGAGRSGLAAKDGTMIAGSQTLQEVADLGIPIRPIHTDGKEWVVVVRDDVEPGSEEATLLGLEDNRSTQVGLDFSPIVLESLSTELDLSHLWTPEEMSTQLADSPFSTGGGELVEERIPSQIFTNQQIIDAAFIYFRATGFPYRKLPLHVCMQEINKLSQTYGDALLHSVTAYQVADTFHPHRFHVSVEGMKSPFEAFQNENLLRKACLLRLEDAGALSAKLPTTLYVVTGTQAVSNFRPAFALYLYRKYAPANAVVLDTSTGYGGRLVGFMASGLARYIGIDPNTLTHAGNQKMATELGFGDAVELLNTPAEDVNSAELIGRCDFAFTSPPYFAKEHYSEESTQSWVRYKTGEQWRDGFLLPMLTLQYVALKVNSYSVINIADVTIGNKTYPLVEWTKAGAQAIGFHFVEQTNFQLQLRFGAGQADEIASEPILVFRK